MPEYVSKSSFMKYHECPSSFWLAMHDPTAIPRDPNQEALDQRLEQGNIVEARVRELFPDAMLIEGIGAAAKPRTDELLAQGATELFQATVVTELGMLAMADVLRKEGDTWALYEVKSTNSVNKDKHLPDAAFQKVAFEAAGMPVGRVSIIHMNKEFVREGDEMNPAKLFTIEDVTDQIEGMLPAIRDEIALALAAHKSPERPASCPCRNKTRGHHCPAFSVFNPDVPEYSVYDISRIPAGKLKELVEANILDIRDVPEGFALGRNQLAQIEAAKTGLESIDVEGIREMLGRLSYPIYFLDYETVAPALPFMDGTHPYQQTVFQYSLHILDTPDAELRHEEYLLRDASHESLEKLVASMRERIGDEGSVVAWHKQFEVGRNTELGQMFPEYADFMCDVNARMFDLEEVFMKGHYVHPEFRGRTSIKFVLPVLVPQFSYKDLNIQKGDIASIRWFDATVGDKKADAEQVYADLLTYCGLDTLAMVEILKVLRQVSAK